MDTSRSIEPGAVIGFVGTGVMGGSMAANLMAAGFTLRVFNRSPERAAPLVEAGAARAESVADAAAGADAVVTIVGLPEDVRQVYFGGGGGVGAIGGEAGATAGVDTDRAAGDRSSSSGGSGGSGGESVGLIQAAAPGAILIDMTTSRPSLARQIHAAAAARGVHALDAPVSGGDVGARAGTLSIMVGGDEGAFAAARPLLAAMGGNIVHQGPAGAGQHTKMCNQIAIASTMVGMVEALLYARGAGLDPADVLESIGAGAAGSWSLSNLYPRLLTGDLQPGFMVRHFVKDLRIARDEADAAGLTLPGLTLALELYEQLEREGGGDLGTQALVRVLEERAARGARGTT